MPCDATLGMCSDRRLSSSSTSSSPTSSSNCDGPDPTSRDADALWLELQRGDWPGVDGFVLQGRRFVVARRGGPLLRWSLLSPREREIVARAAEGASNKAIAAALGIAASTVGVHLARALRKVGASSRAAMLCAYRATQRSP
jgi:DNA-binding CsgD family transcriptional regulator